MQEKSQGIFRFSLDTVGTGLATPAAERVPSCKSLRRKHLRVPGADLPKSLWLNDLAKGDNRHLTTLIALRVRKLEGRRGERHHARNAIERSLDIRALASVGVAAEQHAVAHEKLAAPHEGRFRAVNQSLIVHVESVLVGESIGDGEEVAADFLLEVAEVADDDGGDGASGGVNEIGVVKHGNRIQEFLIGVKRFLIFPNCLILKHL